MIDQTVPKGKQIYLICDNYATHKHENVKRWLEKQKRFHVRFTPTSASWLNMIERFFPRPDYQSTSPRSLPGS